MTPSEAEAPVLTEAAAGVGRIVLNRPRALNAVDLALAQGLEAALERLAGEVAAIVIEGAGGNFSVGGDHREVERLLTRGEAELTELFDSFGRACEAIAGLPVPVIAAVDGYALAGGFELMQACDLAVVADECRIGDEHVAHGMVPGGGGSQRLPRLIGRQRALGMLLTGRRLSGSEAVTLGLALESVPSAQLPAAATSLARTIAGFDREAVATIKSLVVTASETPLAAGLAEERRRIVRHLLRPESMSSFKEPAKEQR